MLNMLRNVVPCCWCCCFAKLRSSINYALLSALFFYLLSVICFAQLDSAIPYALLSDILCCQQCSAMYYALLSAIYCLPSVMCHLPSATYCLLSAMLFYAAAIL